MKKIVFMLLVIATTLLSFKGCYNPNLTFEEHFNTPEQNIEKWIQEGSMQRTDDNFETKNY